MKTLSTSSFIKPGLIKEGAHALPPPQHNTPAVINYNSEFTPEFWYQKLHLAEVERRFRLPKTLLLKLIDIESKGDPNAVSRKQAKGIFGVRPAHISGYTGNIKDPAETALWVAKTLRELADRFGGYEKALAAYNWGRGNLARKGFKNIPPDTIKYIKHFKDNGVDLNPYELPPWARRALKQKAADIAAQPDIKSAYK